MRLWLILCSVLMLSSCHYQFGRGTLSEKYSSISIPYVEDDTDGELTGELIRQISSKGVFKYSSSGAQLILESKIKDTREENIGFRYDRKKSGELQKYITPTESRRIASVEFTLRETSTGKIILGPTVISASMDFDHDYYSDQNASNVSSLGQFVDIDTARDTVAHPLNRLLAEKIVDYIICSW
jgi:hypothetical protein